MTTIKDQIRQLKLALIAALWMAAASGCAVSDHLSADFGQSFERILCKQTLNPHAPDDRTPPEGMAGVIAEKTYTQYKEKR